MLAKSLFLGANSRNELLVYFSLLKVADDREDLFLLEKVSHHDSKENGVEIEVVVNVGLGEQILTLLQGFETLEEELLGEGLDVEEVELMQVEAFVYVFEEGGEKVEEEVCVLRVPDSFSDFLEEKVEEKELFLLELLVAAG